jgi:hypothetical protein
MMAPVLSASSQSLPARVPCRDCRRHPRERVAKEVVKAVQKGRRHVRLPKRSVPFAMLVEVPNRLVHHAEVLTLTGDS